MDGLMVPGRRHTTTLASRDHGGTGPSSAGPSLEPQTGPPLRGAPIIIGTVRTATTYECNSSKCNGGFFAEIDATSGQTLRPRGARLPGGNVNG